MAGSLFDLTAKLGLNIKDFETKLQTTQRKTQKLSKQFKSVGRSMSINLTAPLVGFAALSIKTAGDFEASMKNVQAITGVTGKSFDALEAKAKQLGATTTFTATQVGDAMGFLGMAGFSAQETLAAVGDVLDLAAAGSLDLARAADIASNVMGQFGIEAENTGRVTNVMAAVASSANTNIEQLGEAMKFLGPSAKSLGMSIEDTAAIVGVLGDAGIQASLAGRALGTSLVSLADPTASAKDALAKMKVSAFDVNGEFVGMSSLLSQIEKGTKSFTQEQKAAAIAAAFGKEAFQEINILLERGSQNYANYAQEITGTTKAQEMAQKKLEGFNGGMKLLQSAFEALQIAIANSGLLEWVSGLVKKLAGFFSRLSQLNPEILKWATIIGAVVAAMGPLILAVGAFISIIPTLITGMSAIGAAFTLMTGPIGIVITALAALTAAAVYFWDDIKKPVESGVNFLIDALNWYVNIYRKGVESLIKLSIKAGDALGIDTSGLKSAANDIEKFFDKITIAHVNFDKATSKGKVQTPQLDTSGAGAAASPGDLPAIKLPVKPVVTDTSDFGDEDEFSIKFTDPKADYIAAIEEVNKREIELNKQKALQNQLTEQEANANILALKMAHYEELATLEMDSSARQLELQNMALETKKALDQQAIASDNAVLEQKIQNLNTTQSIVGASLNALKELGASGKAFALLEIATQGGIAMARGIAQSQLPYPANIGAMASTIGAVISSIGQAKKVASGAFANGGMVFGPTMALVGEGAGTTSQNPEVIAPLDKLKGFLGNAGGGGSMKLDLGGEFLVRGEDLVLVLDRANQRNLNRS